jgi:hypothetical protein
MGLFRRKKKYEDTSQSGEDASDKHHGRESAYQVEDQAETRETLSGDAALGPRMAGGLGLPLIGGHFETDLPDGTDLIRAAADPEDDNAREMLIQKERESEERDF